MRAVTMEIHERFPSGDITELIVATLVTVVLIPDDAMRVSSHYRRRRFFLRKCGTKLVTEHYIAGYNDNCPRLGPTGRRLPLIQDAFRNEKRSKLHTKVVTQWEKISRGLWTVQLITVFTVARGGSEARFKCCTIVGWNLHS